MATILIYPFLEAIGAGIAEVAGAVGLGEAASGFLGTAVQGTIAGEIGTTIDSGIGSAISSVVGQENIDIAQTIGTEVLSGPVGPRLNTSTFQTPLENPHDHNTVNEQLVLHEDPETSPQLIADLMVALGNNVGNQAADTPNIVQAHDDLDPTQKETFKKLNGFWANIQPNNEEYQEIEQIYNGDGLDFDFDTFEVDGTIVISNADETGAIKSLSPTTGVVIPAIFGEFVGARSPNKHQPYPITDLDNIGNEFNGGLLDLYAFYHDVSYENGPNRTGDYQFLSRISNNYERMYPEEQRYAKIAIGYFSTIGALISGIRGSLPEDIAEVPSTVVVEDDIYTFLYPNRVNEVSIFEYAQERTEFYAELDEEFKQKHLNDSIMSGSSNEYIKSIFNDIEIILQ